MVALSAACASSGLDGQVYRSDDLAFRVGPIPAGWRDVTVDGALLAFRDDTASASVQVNGRCGLDGDDVPLEALTHHLFLHFTERNLIKQEKLDLDGRAALRTELTAKLDGVERAYLVYVLKKDGCVYDFIRVGPEGQDTSEFERFVLGFETLG